MKTIDVGKEFYHRLANRDQSQGDGRHGAVQFRSKYLSGLDNPEAWRTDAVFIELDFSHVTKIGPSFANEAFAYFTKYDASPSLVLKKIHIVNAHRVHLLIIEEELEAGYAHS